MSQVKVNTAISIPIGERLEVLVKQHLKVTWSDLAKKLNYSNQSTLLKIKRGQSLPSAEKLHGLALLKFENGQINLNWLLTGQGAPLLPYTRSDAGDCQLISHEEKVLADALTMILQRNQNT